MPTETTAPRLIDANALSEKWKSKRDELFALLKYSESALRIPEIDAFIESIDSSPTVDTTDDVLARIPNTKGNLNDGIELHYDPEDNNWKCGYEGCGIYGCGLTILEALKKLEASLNPK